MKALTLVLLLLVAAAPARAEVGFGFGGGVRSVELGLMLGNPAFQEAYGTEGDANVYFTPGKAFPVGIGLNVSQQQFELNKAKHYFDRMQVTEVEGQLVF